MPLVALPAVLKAFLEDEGEGAMEGVGHGDGGGVVVGATAVPVGLEQAEVEVPAVGWRLAGLDGAPGSGGEGDGGGAGGRGEALLRAGVGGVDTPLVDLDGHAAEGGDAVEEEEGAVRLAKGGDALDRLADAGGGLGVDDGDELRRSGAQLPLDGFLGDGGAPGGGHDGDLGAGAGGHLGDAVAEVAADADDGAVARLEEVHDGRFHAAGAGAGRSEGDLVFGAEDLPHHLLAFVHDADELGVEVAEEGQAHGGQHAGIGAAGAGAHEDATGRIKGWNLAHGPMLTADPAREPSPCR